ncbi:MAG TPA: phosphatase PAP2 family protein [Steroidobacteraceae bacterium]
MERARVMAGIATLCAAAAMCGCGTLPDGRVWGEEATWRPGSERLRTAAIDAARDPWVWAPALGAAVFQIDNWDRRASDWAREHTPVFGSQHDAERWSDDLRDASVVAHWATMLATPGGDDPQRWLLSKAKGALVDAAAVASTVAVTRGLKTTFDRERPNGTEDESFPSGHTSSSAVHTRLASRNLRWIEMSTAMRRTLDVGLTGLTLGTSWARIEAGFHFPSDTLFSMALGNFVASFVNDAFLGAGPRGVTLGLRSIPDGAMLSWQVAF